MITAADGLRTVRHIRCCRWENTLRPLPYCSSPPLLAQVACMYFLKDCRPADYLWATRLASPPGCLRHCSASHSHGLRCTSTSTRCPGTRGSPATDGVCPPPRRAHGEQHTALSVRFLPCFLHPPVLFPRLEITAGHNGAELPNKQGINQMNYLSLGTG